ncbi:MAG: hypothetical protein RMJ98_18500 [Myxococcales bacterium]|nr:hypothetical protein [Polyangiaceae bacterium]MDW8251290.1 hypothetical protein [Myxococcales bacterium]
MVALSLPLEAGGHGEPGRGRDLRLITVTIDSHHLDLSYALLLGPASSLEFRKKADLSGDGLLSGNEKEAMATSLRQELEEQLVVYLDGQRHPLRFDATRATLEGDRVNGAPVTLLLRTRMNAGSTGSHKIEIWDRTSFAKKGDLDLRWEAKHEARLLDEAGNPTPSQRILHRHEMENDPQTAFHARFSGGGQPPKSRWPLAAIPGVLLALILAGWREAHRNKRPLLAVPGSGDRSEGRCR